MDSYTQRNDVGDRRIYKQTTQPVEKAVILNHNNENVRNIGQGEAHHRKYKRLKLGGGQAYDRLSI
jgi:hypothetical protein